MVTSPVLPPVLTPAEVEIPESSRMTSMSFECTYAKGMS